MNIYLFFGKSFHGILVQSLINVLELRKGNLVAVTFLLVLSQLCRKKIF
jgi:hypothetical protein